MTYSDRPLDNPINWSFRIGRLFQIDIRVHVAFILCAFVLVAMELPQPGAGERQPFGSLLLDAMGTYAMLFGIVLLHELGHCFGARSVGGEADEILLWPLGGLASVNPPHNATAHMITTLAGPLVNVIICLIASTVLVLWMGTLGAVPWNPIHPTLPVNASLLPTTGQFWLLRFFGISYFILLINLLPIFPFDGGRIVQAWLWPRKGYRASMEIATGTGMVGAIAIGLFSFFIEENWLLLMIAVFGYLTCWQTRKMIREQGAFDQDELGYGVSRGYTFGVDADDGTRKPGFFQRRRLRRVAVQEKKQREREEAHVKAVERVLRKVSLLGLDSLTPKEHKVLEDETKRKQLTDS